MRIFILIVAFLVGMVLFSLSKTLFPPSFLFGFIRHFLLFMGLYWVWKVTGAKMNNKGGERADSIQDNPAVRAIAQDLTLSDDQFYSQAWDEIKNGKTNEPSWARAYASAEGDNEKTAALYIQFRVAQLKEERNETLKEKMAVDSHLIKAVPAGVYAQNNNLTEAEVSELFKQGKLYGYVYKDKLYIGAGYKEDEATSLYLIKALVIILIILIIVITLSSSR